MVDKEKNQVCTNTIGDVDYSIINIYSRTFQNVLKRMWIKMRQFKKILASTFKEYCESTTIHGFSYCITAGKTLYVLFPKITQL